MNAARLILIACLLGFAGQAGASEDVVSLSRAEMLAAPGEIPRDAVLSSGQPDTTVLDLLAESGYVAVVDLRGPDEDRGMDEQAEVEARGMRYMALPVSSKEAISFENAGELDRILQSQDGPVLVHCGSGNRVGALFALRARQQGATEDEALAVGKSAGLTSLEGVVEAVIQQSDD